MLLTNYHSKVVIFMAISFIRETYADDYNSLHQSIMIDCRQDIMSNGLHSRCLREKINPNLHLILVEHIDEKGDVIYAKRA